ncbi:MAG: thiamine phosphate synthase [Qingshengfaniella sp.]
MSTPEHPQIYLVTPPSFTPAEFSRRLAAALDAAPVACLRLALTSSAEEDIARAADTLREIAHARDIPLVIDRHVALVERLGLDGVHLTDGSRSVRKTRKTLGEEAIIGVFCGTSRHDGMTAGEAGADYVAFGPAGQTALGDGSRAEPDLFAWWSEMIEVPVVAEGALGDAEITALAPVADFIALGDEIWGDADPAARLKAIYARLSGG